MSQSLDIIFEDNHLLVINKPALLPTMGVAADEVSLVTLAKSYLKEKYNKPGNVYVGVVSRLDAFVSGVIVLARTSKAASRLTAQFSKSTPEKRYWAIVPTDRCLAKAELENWLVKDDEKHRMMTVQDLERYPGAKRAKLSYHRIGEFQDQSLIEVRLETGRKHQIRVQLAAAGMPIIGDRKYGSRNPFRTGIALHSRSLKIVHPTLKTNLSFQNDPPSWWQLARFVK